MREYHTLPGMRIRGWLTIAGREEEAGIAVVSIVIFIGLVILIR